MGIGLHLPVLGTALLPSSVDSMRELFCLLFKGETAPEFVQMLWLVNSWWAEVTAGSGMVIKAVFQQCARLSSLQEGISVTSQSLALPCLGTHLIRTPLGEGAPTLLHVAAHLQP